jgi:ribose 5-phosphate isomerase B
MRDQGGRPAPSADEIRDIVRRVVDATLPVGVAIPGVSTATAGVASSVSPSAAPAPGPATAAAGGPGKVAVAIGGDHGGYAMKDRIGAWLRENGFEVRDCGTNSPEAVDYPDIAHAVARLVADGTCRWGIIVDGAGIGSCMVANKVPGIRAALCYDLSSARNSREHNHANVLTLGAGLIGERLAIDIVQTWLGTVWGMGRHAARVDKITAVERRYTTTDKEVRG